MKHPVTAVRSPGLVTAAVALARAARLPRLAPLVVLAAAACADPGSLAVSAVEQASSSAGHTAASDWAFNRTCAWQFMQPVNGLPAQTVAERYGLDPDCGTTSSSIPVWLPGGRLRMVGDCINSWPPDLSWSSPLNSINSSLAMCSNWDHFSNNNFGLETNAQMITALQQMAATASSQGDRQRALHLGFEACHYAVDRNQCGHSFGNMVCDPNAQVLSQECVNFVNNFAWVGTQFGGYNTMNLVAGCTFYGQVNVYATAERYIRHHNPGMVLDNPAWVNHCPAGCPGGDSDGPIADACQLGGNNSDNLTCENTLNVTCNSACTPRTCAQLGYPSGLVLECGRSMCCSDAACGPGYRCNSSNSCEQVTSCIAFPPQCGSYYDSCGIYHPGSTCFPGSVCQNGSCVACDPSPPQCGSYFDRCGTYHPGSSCPSGWTCQSGSCYQAPSCIAFPPECGGYYDTCGIYHSGSSCPASYACSNGSCVYVGGGGGGGGNQCWELDCDEWCGGTGSCFNGVCYCGT